MEMMYEFVELESEESFRLLGTAFNATNTQNALVFDNAHVKGELIRISPEDGLWVRKWKMTVLDNIILKRNVSPRVYGRKFSLIYFLNPSIFIFKSKSKKIKVRTRQNNMLLSNKVPMQFSVVPHQPFYALDITFTDRWLMDQFGEEDQAILTTYLERNMQQVTVRSSQGIECRLLHELEQSIQSLNQDAAFIRPRIYSLVLGFFSEILNPAAARPKLMSIHYDQMVEAERILSQQLQSRPKIEEVAKQVNMSASTLLRQFKTMYGKSVYEYHMEKKMELGKKMIHEDKISVKEAAKLLGYKQVSPFIESFTKQYGCTPGSMKDARARTIMGE